MKTFITRVTANPKNLTIMQSVLNQMMDGILEASRNEKYWKNMELKIDHGFIAIADDTETENTAEFFARRLKALVKLEENGTTIVWSRTCAGKPQYFDTPDTGIPLTVGDIYMIYDQLKGRSTGCKWYSTSPTVA